MSDETVLSDEERQLLLSAIYHAMVSDTGYNPEDRMRLLAKKLEGTDKQIIVRTRR